MRRKRALALAAAATAAVALATTQATAAVADTPAAGGAQPLSTAQAAQLSQNVNTPVIVLLKNQPGAATANRANAISTSQDPLVGELSQVHAQHVTRFHVANAVSATVSKDEAARLATNPAVQAVIPDGVIKGAPPAAATAAEGAASTPAGAAGQDVCPAPGKTMLEPEALPDTHTASDDPTAKTARSLGFDGAGVKVAYLAEGIDINNPDFIRANGQHVFADYQDFSGDGTNAATSGGEAFLDASAIAAQGRQVYNVQNFGAHPLPTPCDIRIEGVAPGASLYGFKVFGNNDYSTTSGFLQAIDWAVNHDHVDVINESFGTNPFPDSETSDAVKLFDDYAVASGVTVTVSSGDAGITSTEGSPASDPKVISAGASTTFRWYAQTDYGALQTFAKNGWLNDNVSSLSSSGFTQNGSTVDLLAPGDSSFALCTPDPDLYEDCADFNGNPSSVERSGGTSESAPLTAGASALVIQAYRKTHHGASPSPAEVKQILVSTADDLTEPGDEQGAGLLDTYKAVQAAESIKDGNGAPQATGSTLLVDQAQLTATGPAGSNQQWQVKVTNNGSSNQTVNLADRGFGAPQNKQTGSVTLSDAASPKFADWSGVSNNYGTLHFSVPAGTQRLSASIAYPGDPNASLNARTRLILVDPQGRYAAHSLPQGVGNFGNVDVRFPAAGQWTAIIFSPTTASGGTAGRVAFSAITENTDSFGSVSPASLTLKPGQTGTVTVRSKTPAQAGDASGALVLNAGAAGQTSVPIVLRSLVSLSGGGSFHGTLTGGNGREPDTGQGNFYAFDVPQGQHDLDVSAKLTNDAGDNLVAYLVGPDGQKAATGINKLTTAFNPTTRDATQSDKLGADLYVRNPQAGRWLLVLDFAGAIVGDELSQPFSGSVQLNKVSAHATAPNGATLPAGKAVTVPVQVRNTGSAAEDFFVDPRLTSTGLVPLAANQTGDLPLPMPGDQPSPAWLVPSESTGVAVQAKATLPVNFDFGPFAGDPDLPSVISNGNTAYGAAFGPSEPNGLWAADPAEFGPAGPNGWPSGSVSMSMYALTQNFDPNATSAGDLWRTSITPATTLPIVTVQPGQTVTIPVTITPSGAKGTVVRGNLYVDQLIVTNANQANSFNFSDFGAYEETGNDLAAIPYSYTIG
jgi:hypothetical protein